ncbi:peptidyl-prolyl cis-trans isomerase C [Litoreibacter halocynthiae]|uniref:Parvulin-like PPIase n=1 Tax=Litoreibacter halocynthiae TaxID=1242689 RepID=A0A4V6Q381_9RHOB|nr:peptidylprolyl isomerase [Litoreibacter halocynthiae]TDT73245.1 peptidyl-prolyl cis-trans isomerase C [Litoreibacter halocynthiae]
MGKFSTLLRATGLAVTVAMPAAAQDATTVMATVNGTDITLGHMIALQERLPEQYKQLEDAVLFDGILEQLIQQTALSQEMEKDLSGAIELSKENEIRAFLAGELLAKIGTADVDEAAVEEVYKERFAEGEPDMEFNASHILVETEDEAKELITMLADGADFAELAKEKSTGPSGPGGGSLGWFGKGAMVPAFEQAVVAMEDDTVSEPVQTQFGWHVIKRNESRVKEAPALDDVRDEIERELRAKAIDDEITRLTDTATVSRTEVEVDPAAIRDVGLLSK